MRLLIITQVVDSQHPILGFFHRWIEEFAKHCDCIHVICLQEGWHNLPKNVIVHSLGKEEGKGRWHYLARFYSLIWQLRHEYDNVFVHMNQEYVLLAGVYWGLIRKPVLMWRNHYSGSWRTHLAVLFCKRVFYTSRSSYTQRFKKAQKMPIGLDETLFSAHGERRVPSSLLYVGRISASKRIEVIIDSLKNALRRNPSLTLSIVGAPSSAADEATLEGLQKMVETDKLPVRFVGPVVWEKLPTIYSQHEVCINMSPPGMFDKVIGEALLCGCDIVTTNNDVTHLLGERVIPQDKLVEALSEYLATYQYNSQVVQTIRTEILAEHGLKKLVRTVLESTDLDKSNK